jgi:hypothetical protein
MFEGREIHGPLCPVAVRRTDLRHTGWATIRGSNLSLWAAQALNQIEIDGSCSSVEHNFGTHVRQVGISLFYVSTACQIHVEDALASGSPCTLSLCTLLRHGCLPRTGFLCIMDPHWTGLLLPCAHWYARYPSLAQS